MPRVCSQGSPRVLHSPWEFKQETIDAVEQSAQSSYTPGEKPPAESPVLRRFIITIFILASLTGALGLRGLLIRALQYIATCEIRNV